MNQRFEQLNTWFGTARGQRLANVFKRHLEVALPTCHGERLLQVGIAEQQNWLANSPVKTKLWLTPFYMDNPQLMVSSLYELPIQTNSIDVALCPLTLELLSYPLSLISELDRILSASGEIIFIGVNPISLWGLPRLWRQPSNFAVWQSHVFSMSRLNKVMRGYGYSIEWHHRFGYSPPCVMTDRTQRFFESFGRMILPFPTGFYMLKAKKQTITPLMSFSSDCYVQLT